MARVAAMDPVNLILKRDGLRSGQPVLSGTTDWNGEMDYWSGVVDWSATPINLRMHVLNVIGALGC